MKNYLRSFILILGFLGGFFGSGISYARLPENAVMDAMQAAEFRDRSLDSGLSDAVLSSLMRLDTPVFQFKTVGKDPYVLKHNTGAHTLEIITLGCYPGAGSQVNHIARSEDLANMIPIRHVTLCCDAGVKIDAKFPGYRESYVGRLTTDMFAGIGLMPDKYYKGALFVDEYVEAIPSKWYLRDVRDFDALRKYLQPLFEQHNLLGRGLQKPLLVLQFEKNNVKLSEDDYAFLGKYFQFCDLTDPVVLAFFNAHQTQIFEEIGRLGDAKYVKETLFEMFFRYVEKMGNEFKGKEIAAAVLYALVTAVTVDIAKGYIRDWSAQARRTVDTEVVPNIQAQAARVIDPSTAVTIAKGAGFAAVLGLATLAVATAVTE